MSAAAWAELLVLVALLAISTPLLGNYMAKVYGGSCYVFAGSATTTPPRDGCAPATAPAARAPPNIMMTSDGTGMQADSASISTNTAR